MKLLHGKFKIRGISDNLREGNFSNVLTFSDQVQPDVISANYPGGDQLEVFFDEPLEKALAENPSNYSIEDSTGTEVNVTIEEIIYNSDYGTSAANEEYNTIITVANGGNLNTG